MTNVLARAEVAYNERPPQAIDQIDGELLGALMEQQSVLLAGGVAQPFEGTTTLSDFLRTNPTLDPERGRLPLQPDITFLDRLFKSTTGVLHELNEKGLDLTTYGFTPHEREEIAGIWHGALLYVTADPDYPSAELLLSAMRGADAAAYEERVAAVHCDLIRLYAESVEELGARSLRIQQRYIDITEARAGRQLTKIERLHQLRALVSAADVLHSDKNE